MIRPSNSVIAAFAVGFMAAIMAVSGCNEAAARKLTIFQLQSTQTYSGPFKIDTSELPAGAVKSLTQAGKPGKPETQLTFSQDYQIEVVFRLADAQNKSSRQDREKP